ncbi:MAG: hypothetical protein KF784_07635 [Fimbriimonadaceae bacterium]|nr:hypothetical protein [Fimbriimonadaceae bacterium]
MITAALACLVIGMPAQQAEPIQLGRVYTKGEKAKYEVHSKLTTESRQVGLDTWIPDDLDLIYQYSYEVVEMKADGICVMRYLRPTMTQIKGATADAPAKKTTEKVDYNLELTVSPSNELLNVKDLTPKKDPKKPPTVNFIAAMRAGGKERQDVLGGFLNQFVGEIYRLAMFAGSLDSSLDFNPKMPYDETKVGETWKRTVGYSPQKQQGSEKMAVQRMDYTYTYKGIVDVSGQKYQRITADILLKSDLAEFIHQSFNVKSSVTGLKEIPLNFKASVDFDLDPKTFKTIRANGTSSGGFSIFITDLQNEALQEERFQSRISMKIVP